MCMIPGCREHSSAPAVRLTTMADGLSGPIGELAHGHVQGNLAIQPPIGGLPALLFRST
jgi:hypothetical protein